MAEPRGSYHHGDLKRALVEAAIAIVRERGAEAFTLREAARRVGVTHRAAYRHFEDKTAVLAAVAEQGYRELGDRMHAERERVAPDVRAELLAMSRAYVAFAVGQPAHFHVMFGPSVVEGGTFRSMEAEARRALALIMGTFERGFAEGLLKPELGQDAAVALWSSIHGFASLVLTRRVRVKKALLGSYTDTVIGPTIEGLFVK
jgi:AcrR family transcriptional regulator